MKKILFIWMMLLPIVGMSQIDPKYGVGAVPMENGRVIFTKVIEAPVSAQEMYEIANVWASENFKQEKEMPNRKIYESNDTTLEIIAGGEEFIVFTARALSLDRTRVYYKMNISCHDKKLTARIYDIRYWYEEERNGGQKYKAEEWITDEMGLNKKKTKLARLTGKFRRKTIDRVDELFNDLEMTISRKVLKDIMQEEGK